MAVRPTMQTNLIPRVRLLINDPGGTSETFHDQDIQDVLDESRVDVLSGDMIAKPTWSGNQMQWLDYFTELGGWEDGMILKQYLITVVTPATSEPIVGHWTFAASTYPPVFITGKLYDVYRAAADLLERMAAHWIGANGYDFSSDGQSFRRSQANAVIERRIASLRRKQRAGSISMTRTDQNVPGQGTGPSLAPTALDYYAQG